MQKYIPLIVLILTIFTNSIYARSAEIDSLKTALTTAEGKEKVVLLNLLSKAYWNIDPEQTLKHSQKALQLARKYDYKREIARAINNIGVSYYFKGEYNKSLENLKESLKYRKELENRKDIIASLNNIGIVYNEMNENEKAIEYYRESMRLEEKEGNLRGVAGSLNNIGIAYENLNQYNKALENFRKAQQLYEEIGDLYGSASTQSNIGIILGVLANYDKAIEYHLNALKLYEKIGDISGKATSLGNIGIIYDDIGENEKALEYYLRSLKIERELKNPFGIAGKLNNIGIIYDDMKNYHKALDYYLQSMEQYEKLGHLNGLGNTCNNIGVVYENLEEFDKAIEYLQKAMGYYKRSGKKKGFAAVLNNLASVYAKSGKDQLALNNFFRSLEIAKEINLKDLIIEIYEKISNVYASQNNYRTALKYFKLYSQVKDSIFSKERSEIVTGIETTYEVELQLEEQEKEIELLQKDNEIYKLQSEKQKLLMWLMFFGITILLVLGFLIYYRYRLNIKAKHALEQQVDMRTKDLQKANKKLKREIKERKELQNQLILSERMAAVGELAAGVAHEIRNPLGNISSAAQLCLSKFPKNKELNEFLEIIREDSEKANSIIRGLLDFANPREVNFTKASVRKILDKVKCRIGARCQENNIKVQIDQKNDIPLIPIDSKWLEQAFLNFSLNAIHAIEKDGELVIELSKSPKFVIIKFIDNGIGIKKENLAKIFDPFYTTREEGVGLGLSLSHQIIKDHNGEIELESKVNVGTTVIVKLPIE